MIPLARNDFHIERFEMLSKMEPPGAFLSFFVAIRDI